MKKILVFILVGMMLLTTLCLPLSAAADVWDGTADTSWYDASKKVFTLTTAKQLAGLASLVNGGNNFSDKKIVLNADIDLNNVGWAPIGTEANQFFGTFDGRGHTISNLKNIGYNGQVDDWGNTANFLGLFGYITKATVKNVGIVNADIAHGAGNNYGALAGFAYASDIVNCCVIGGSVKGWHTVGGLVGEIKSDNGGTSSVIGCYVIDVTVTAGSGLDVHSGGLICNMTGAGNVRNCYSATNLERLFSGADKTAGAGVSNCYYKAASEGGSDKNGAVAKTEAQMKGAAFVETMNTGLFGDMEFVAVSGSYPKLRISASATTSDGLIPIAAVAVVSVYGILFTKRKKKQ